MLRFKIVLLFALLIMYVPLFSQTNFWQGDFWPNAWNTPEAWSLNHVPTFSEDAVIPAGLTNYPFLVGFCTANDLVLHDGAEMEIRNGLNLDIYGNFEIAGTINHNGVAPEGDISVDGYVRWHGTSLMEENWQDPAFNWRVYGNWYFEPGCEVDMNHHTVEFVGSDPVYIYTKSANAKFYHISPYKSGSTVTWSSTSTYDLETNYLYNRTNTTFQTWNTRSIIVKTFFNNQGTLQLHAGTFKWGYSGGTTTSDATDYFHHMELHPYYTTGTTFNGDVVVNGNFTAEYGGPSPGALTFNGNLTVKGDFESDMGDKLSISKLTFDGPGINECIGARCDTLVLEKVPGDELRIPSDSTIAGQYDWVSGYLRVNGGYLQAFDLIDPGIVGTISLTSGEIHFNQDASQFIDLRAYLFMTNGLFSVTGGSGDSYWPWSDPATLNMSGGTLSFENGIYINNNAGFIENITGGTIQTKEDFRVVRPDFHPDGGTIQLYGTLTGQDSVRLHCSDGSYLHDLAIDKFGGEAVVTTSDIDINGDFSLHQGFLKSNDEIDLAGNWTSSGLLNFYGDGSVVRFNGTSGQTFQGIINFDQLILDNDLDTLFVLPFAYMNINSYNWEGGTWHMDDATVYMFDLADFGVYGTYFLENSSYLQITQDPARTVDINAHITLLSESDMDLYGGNGTSDWANFTDASLTMEDGTYLYFDNSGINMHNTHLFTEHITGGYIQVMGDFICNRTDFNPAGGTVVLSGDKNTDVSMGTGSTFYDLWILNGVYGNTTEDTITANTDLLIENDLMIFRGAFVPMDLEIKGDWTNEIGQEAFVEGTNEVIFSGTSSSGIAGDEGFYDLTIQKTSAIFESLVLSSGDSLTVENNCHIMDGQIRMADSSMLSIKEDLIIDAGAGLTADPYIDVDFVVGGHWINSNATQNFWQGFNPGTARVTFDGYGNQDVEQAHRAGSFYDLYIKNHDFNVELLYSTKVLNDFILIKGTVFAPDSLWVGGDWSEAPGAGGFVPGSDIVIFDGSGPSDLLSDGTFHNLRVAKTYTSYDGFELAPNITLQVLNDLNIYTGTLEMNDHSELDVDGDLTITANAGLNAGDDTGLKIYVGGDWYDNNTAWSNKIGFNPGTSEVTFDGPVNQALYCNATDADFFDLFINKPSGLITEDFVSFHTNMKILRDAEVLDGRWYDLPAGGFEHQFFGRLIIYPGAKWFGGNSTIIFKADGDQKWGPSPTIADCSFHHVTLDKPSGTVLLLEDTRSLNGGFLSVQNGSLDLNGNSFYVAGNAEVLENGEVIARTGGELFIGIDPM
jgi:hypothetical protein